MAEMISMTKCRGQKMATEKRLIDANDVPELLEKEFARKWRLVLDGETHLDSLAEGFFSAKSVIWAMPTVDAVEVVHGEWTVIENDYDCTTTLECSVCEMSFCFEDYDGLLPQAQTYHYCPNCGAKMDGDGND